MGTSTLRKKRQLVDALNALTEEALKADAEKINQDAAPKEQRQVHRMACSGAIDSQCRGKKCVVSCADGEEGVEISLKCDAGFVDVSLENNDASKVLVRCGTQEEVGRVRGQNTNPFNFGFVKCKTVKEEGVVSKMLEDSVMCRDARAQDASKPIPVGLVMYRIVQGEGVGS